MIELEQVPDVEDNQDVSAEPMTLTSPSPLCRRLKSTIQATLETGVPRLVLIAACLASAIGAESWSPHCSHAEDSQESRNAEEASDNFVTDIFTECLDPVLQLALQQCHMEAMNSISQVRSQTTNARDVVLSNSPQFDANCSRAQLSGTTDESDEESLVDALFRVDVEQPSVESLIPNCNPMQSEEYTISPSITVNQTQNSPLRQITIENQLAPRQFNNDCQQEILTNRYRLLPPTLAEIDNEWRECLVCSEYERSVIVSPCGHIITCENCAPLVKKCLLCRQRITEYHQVSSYKYLIERPFLLIIDWC